MSHIGNGQTNVYEIARILGHCSVDVGQLCTSVKVKPFSKWKPFRHTSPNFASDSAQEAALVAAKYGLTGPVFLSPADLIAGTPANGAMNYNYEKPNQYYRIRDFLNYFHRAKPCFMQAAGATFTVDLVPPMPDTFPFYLLFGKYSSTSSLGLLSNKAFIQGGGINTSAQAVDSGDLDYNITVEDLTFADSLGSYNLNLLGPDDAYLGIVVDKGSGQAAVRYAEFFEDTYPVEEQTTLHNEMFKIDMSGVGNSLAIGDYTAVACAKVNDGNFDYYLPVFSKKSYPAKFTLKCGGLNNYAVEYRGLGTSPTGDFMTNLTGVSRDEVYVKVRFYNKRGSSLQAYINGNIKFCLQYTVQSVDLGNNVTSVEDDQGNYITVNKTVDTIQMYYPDPSTVSYINIDNNDYAEFVFKVVKPFQDSDTSATAVRVSGSYVNIIPKLKFKTGSSDYFPVRNNAGYPTLKYTLS